MSRKLERYKNGRILVIGKVWPEPDSSAAGSRMMQLLELFRENKMELVFASPASGSKYAADLESLEVTTVPIRINDASFDRFVRELNPGIVLFDRFMTEEQFGWRIAEQCPDAVRILDTEDLHLLRKAREKAWKQGITCTPGMIKQEELALREIASIYRCDLTLVISRFEMNLLTEQFGVSRSLLHYLPFLFEPVSGSTRKTLPVFDERHGFISIGNFLHEPNRNAVFYLRERIWHLIRKQIPGAMLYICGAYPSQEIQQLHNPAEGFCIEGRVEDAAERVSRSRVLLAPLQFGAGLKGKLTEAMRCGTPSVTTPVGAEGIAAPEHWSGRVENSPGAFAEAAVQLYTGKAEWQDAQRKGFDIIKNRFDRKKFIDPLIRRLEHLITGLENHRRDNFIGSMLLHHTTASTKYMSKWIEGKNR